MIIDFPYGEGEIDLKIPDKNLEDILKMEKVKKIENVERAIKNSLMNPIGCPSLEESVNKKDEVVLIVNDNTRACPDDIIAPVLLNMLKDIGVKVENTKIIVAYGLHPPLDEEGLINLLGENVVNNYDIINHDPDKTSYIGKTSRDIPISVNKHVLNADFRISTGFIEPHFFAGFSGGRKSIMPGISGRESIYNNHSFKMIGSPYAKAGQLDKNPIHLDAVEHAKKVGLDFIINVILNKKKDITHIVSGDPIKAHSEGVKKEKDIVLKKVESKPDIVITTNNGLPLDLNLYQTVKGIAQASTIVKKGGIIIVAAECREGIGPDMFYKIHKESKTPNAILKHIKDNEPIEAQWENQVLAEVQKENKILIKSELKDEIVKDMLMEPIKNLREGLDKAFEEIEREAKVVAIPEGPMVIPSLK